MSVNDDIQLKKAENAWKPGMKREGQSEETEAQKTQAGRINYPRKYKGNKDN